jgi:hypothetical protein
MYGLGGIEIISPPMSVSKQWQEEIETVFQAVGQTFDFWTNECCACHVHVSPGPTKSTKYTMPQLVRMAKGAFFWENALCDLLPPERRDNRYANPNYTGYATDLYDTVPRFGWGPVFSSLSSLGQAGQSAFVMALKGGPGPNETRYMSTNFDPLARLGTVELRRQAGVASAQTTIHRVLLAVTFHVSALRYNFAGAAQRTEYTHGDELIRELAGCIKQLPDTCKGSRFVAWLKWCDESYANSRSFTERQINSRERALRNGAPAVPEAAPPPPRNLPSARRAITPPPQRPPGLSVRVNLPSARGPPLQQPPRQQQQPVRLPVRSGPPPAAPSPPPPLPSARHRDESPVRRPLARRNTARAPSRAPSPRRSGPSRASAARDESPPRTRNRRPLIQRDESPPRPPLQQRRPRRQDSQSSSGRPVVQVVYDNYVDPSRYQHQERYGY